MTDIENNGNRTLVKEEIENISNIDGTHTVITRKHYSDGSIVESSYTKPAAIVVKAVPIAASTTKTSPTLPTTTSIIPPTAMATAVVMHNKKKKTKHVCCFAISISVTGVVAIVLFLLSFIPFAFIGGIIASIACAILGIVQCATGNCCCGSVDDDE
jgi:hypothetical protein